MTQVPARHFADTIGHACSTKIEPNIANGKMVTSFPNQETSLTLFRILLYMHESSRFANTRISDQ